MVDTATLKPYLIPYLRTITKQVNKRFFICPFCNSGANKNKTPAFSVYDNGTRCGCMACGEVKNADIIELCMKYNSYDFKTAVDTLLSVYSGQNVRTGENIPPQQKNARMCLKTQNKAICDFTANYRKWRENYRKCDYLKNRGIGDELARKFWIGYDMTFPNNPNLIIPVNATSYVKRGTAQGHYFNVADFGIFNLKALQNGAVVFVDEGAINALSIMEVGGTAIALNSVVNVGKLIEYLSTTKIKPKLILRFDNDLAGRNALKKMQEACEKLDITHIEAFLDAMEQDPNELLTKDRDMLKTLVKRDTERIKSHE